MPTILVVDDDESIRRLVSNILESAGNRTVTAANGAEAVAVYRSYADHIDLVITDINMPVMDGVQEILRIRMTNPNAKIICMTSDLGDQRTNGAVLLSKPFSTEKFLQTVNGLIRQNTT
jgi:CheY-like chemotaxis protein